MTCRELLLPIRHSFSDCRPDPNYSRGTCTKHSASMRQRGTSLPPADGLLGRRLWFSFAHFAPTLSSIQGPSCPYGWPCLVCSRAATRCGQYSNSITRSITHPWPASLQPCFPPGLVCRRWLRGCQAIRRRWLSGRASRSIRNKSG